MLRPWRFRTVLPIAMTALQLGLSVASLVQRWQLAVDVQRDVSRGIRASRSRLQNTLRLLLRGAAIFLFPLFATVFTRVNHRHAGAAILLACTWLRWSGIYLLLSFWGESRETKLARAKASTCTASES